MRTVEDFVEDMCKRGRTPEQVEAVAILTRWESQQEKAVLLAKAECKTLASLGRSERVNNRMGEFVRRRKKLNAPRKTLILKKS